MAISYTPQFSHKDWVDFVDSVQAGGTNGINIPFDSFAQTDVRKTVRLRNLNLNGVNTGLISTEVAPFGGMKESSSHSREQGRAAMEFFTSTKTVYMDRAGL